MGRKLTSGLFWVASLIAILSPVAVASAAAQGLSIEWVSWDAQITAHTKSTQLDIVETQNIN